MKLPTWRDEKLESIVGNLLRTGVSVAAIVVFVGGAIFLIHHGQSYPAYHVFQGEPENLKSIPAIFRYALQMHGAGIIQVGLLMLIATPVVRVAFSVVGFALERDRLYVAFTLMVLAILLYSLFGTSFA